MHGWVRWRAMKYEEEQPREKWHLTTVLAACTQLIGEEAKSQFRRELVTHAPTIDKTYLERLGINDKKKTSLCGKQLAECTLTTDDGRKQKSWRCK